MKMYNEEGQEINVDAAQMQLMTDNGWTRNKPDPKKAEADQKAKDEADQKAKDEADQKAKDDADDTTDGASGGKKKKRKAIKK